MRTNLHLINRTLLIVYVLVAIPLWINYLRPSAVTPGFFRTHIEQLRRHSQENAQLRTINLLMPANYKELMAFLNSPEGRDPQALSSYALYFRALAQKLPAPLSADAHAMLGFCHYHQHKTAEALSSYMTSLEINPIFLWTYFNLALIHFRDGNYEQSVALVERMMSMNPELSLRVITSSKIYTDILRDQSGFDLAGEVKKTYADALRIAVISQYRLKNFPQVVETARYAIQSGFGPPEVFNNYASLATGSEQDRRQAEALFKEADVQKGNIYTGQDISARFF